MRAEGLHWAGQCRCLRDLRNAAGLLGPQPSAYMHHVARARARTRTHRPAACPQRFPRWMWRNTAFESFVEWLRRYNAAAKAEARGESLRAGMV